MPREKSIDELVASLPRGKRGLLFIRQARDAEARRNSPRGRAGRIGGLITAHTYPAAKRPRGADGRFLPEHDKHASASSPPGRAAAEARSRRTAGAVAGARTQALSTDFDVDRKE